MHEPNSSSPVVITSSRDHVSGTLFHRSWTREHEFTTWMERSIIAFNADRQFRHMTSSWLNAAFHCFIVILIIHIKHLFTLFLNFYTGRDYEFTSSRHEWNAFSPVVNSSTRVHDLKGTQHKNDVPAVLSRNSVAQLYRVTKLHIATNRINKPKKSGFLRLWWRCYCNQFIQLKSCANGRPR